MQARKRTTKNGLGTGQGMAGGGMLPPARPLSQLVHDLHQPLSAINSYAQAGSHLIDSGLTDTARLKELFDKISQQCGRAALLSQELGRTVAGLPPGKELF